MIYTSPKEGYGYIYRYTSPSGKNYVGQTTYSLYHRSGPIGENYQKCPSFYKAIKKYGFENFNVEILAVVPEEQLDDMEAYYIEVFDSYYNGYNETKGGRNTTKLTEKARKVYQYSAEDGHFIREWESGAAAAKQWGQMASVLESCLQNKTYTQYGYCWSYTKMDKFPIYERLIDPTPKKVRQYTLEGELIKEYPSISAASKETGIGHQQIRKCCKKEAKTAGGFKWESEEALVNQKFNNTAKPIAKIDINTNEIIQVYPSIRQAAIELGKETSLIRRVLDDPKRTAYGFRWKTAQGSTTTDP